MAFEFRCTRGHVWQATEADTGSACPSCGAPSQTLDFPSQMRTADAAATSLVSSAVSFELPGYHVLHLLGEGGMGAVYKARHIALNRLVALKVIHPDRGGGQYLLRFRKEAEAVAALPHPNIIQIYEVSEYGGRPFLSLEYAEGGSLADRLRQSPLNPREAARIVRLLADAMQAAHEAKILHRDLKPANVLLASGVSMDPGSATPGSMLTPLANLIPKITDFGLAKKLEDPSGPTRSGAILGTPSYMAPEQASGGMKEVGPAADVYALGAILYECVTGRPPFRAATAMETLYQVLQHEPISPRQLNPALDRDLETIVLKCLHKEPRQRYASAAALEADLQCYLDGRPIAARPVGPLGRLSRWCKRNPAVAALLAVVVLSLTGGIAVSTYFAFDAAAQAEEARTQEQAARYASATAQQKEQEARESAEQARNNAEAAKNSARDALDQKTRAEQNESRALRLLYGANINAAHRMWNDGNLKSLRSLLVALGPDKPGRVDFRGFEWSHLRWLAYPDAPSILLASTRPAFSADGNHAAVRNQQEITIRDMLTGRQLTRILGQRFTDELALSPGGTHLAVALEDGTIEVWSPGQGRASASWKPGPRPLNALAISAGGRLVATTTADGTLKLWEGATGKEVWQAPTQVGGRGRLLFSPDGRLLAATPMTIKPGQAANTLNRISVFDLEAKKELSEIRGHDNLCRALAFSKDGKFLASAGSDRLIKVWSVESGQETATLQGHTGQVNALAFSRTHHQLVSGGADAGIILWDLKSHRRLRTLRIGDTEITHLYTPATDTVVCATSEQSEYLVRTFDLAKSAASLEFPSGGREETLLSMSFGPGGTVLASRMNALLRWNARGELLTASLVNTTIDFADSDPIRHQAAVVQPGKVRIIALENGGELLQLAGVEGSPVRVRYSPDGRLLAVILAEDLGKNLPGKVVVFQTSDWVRKFVLSAPTREPFLQAEFSSDSKTLAVSKRSAESASVVLHDEDGNRLRELKGDFATPHALAFHPRAPFLALGGEDHAIQVWPLEGKDRPRVLHGHTGRITSLAFSPDGERLASGADDGAVKLWDVQTGQELLSLVDHEKRIRRILFDPSGRRLLSAGDDGLRVWPARMLEPGPVLAASTRSVPLTACHPGGTLVALGDARGIRFFAPATGTEMGKLDPPAGKPLACLEWGPDGRMLAAGGSLRPIVLWPNGEKSAPELLGGNETSAFALRFSRDGSKLYSNQGGRQLCCWNVAQRQLEWTSREDLRGLGRFEPAPDGLSVAVANNKEQILVLDAGTGQVRYPLVQGESAFATVTYSPDGKLLAAGGVRRDGASGIIIVWDTQTRKALRPILALEGATALAFHPGCKILATGHRGGSVQLWDALSGGRLVGLHEHRRSIRSLTFSADGKTLVSCDYSGEVRVSQVFGISP